MPEGAKVVDASVVTMAVARNVRDERKGRRWTQEELAAQAGISKGMVVQIEQGRTNPSVTTLYKLAQALNVSLRTLIDADPQPVTRVVMPSDVMPFWESDGGSKMSLLVASDRDKVEIWKCELMPEQVYTGRAHSLGSREILLMTRGRILLDVDGETHAIGKGGTVLYEADRPHTYTNLHTSASEFFLALIDSGRATRRK